MSIYDWCGISYDVGRGEGGVNHTAGPERGNTYYQRNYIAWKILFSIFYVFLSRKPIYQETNKIERLEEREREWETETEREINFNKLS